MSDRPTPTTPPRGPAVAVGRLSLRVPGPPGTNGPRASSASAEFGRRVAARAAALLAERLPPDAAGQIGHVRLRVPVRAGGAATSESMSEAIAEALCRALGRSG